MLTYDEAKKIGINACIDKLGRDFVEKYRETSCSAYGDVEDYAYCFVGVNDKPDVFFEDGDIVLSFVNERKFPYMASCNVEYKTGNITFLECILPKVCSEKQGL